MSKKNKKKKTPSEKNRKAKKKADDVSKHQELSKPELDRLEKMAANLPGLMEYAHNVGGVPIVPTEEGVIKGKAMQAMQEQSSMQMNILADFMKLAMHHAQKINERAKVSLDIYNTKIQFQPQIGKEYWLYKRKDGQRTLSLVSPMEWGDKEGPLGTCQARVKLLADHTWELVDAFEDFDLETT